ncbi:GTPase [Klebsormidium nitens]|uniref:GTPase n=1 Tax=Klebsormidium nitens TaxID=105231 RepID=A0A1Y1I3K7_KLENI|nr:GTPase [Klebsormidium nitens]|eukprot:GAQ83761.1 GTPase [Klebsormidium nitens]
MCPSDQHYPAFSSRTGAFSPKIASLPFLRWKQVQLRCSAVNQGPNYPPQWTERGYRTWRQPETEAAETSGQHGDFDTIAAIVTPLALGDQPGAVAIVRLSGPKTVDMVRKIFKPFRRKDTQGGESMEWHPESHKVEYGKIVDASGALVDEVIMVPMLAPRSYTREDVIEIQCHGGQVPVRRVLNTCLEAGARLAKPGEFTLRAFLNGRLDLSQAEGIADLINARTTQAAESALSTMQRGLSSFVTSLRAECIDLLVEMEARLDFDEELPPFDVPALIERIHTISQRLQKALATAQRGRLLQAGMRVAIIGRPNVGKSSLLNAWSNSDRAIVTNIPGTTRDVVEAAVSVGGIPVYLLDTAGIRDTADAVEKIGVERSKDAAAGADVVVMVVSAADGWTERDDVILSHVWGASSSGSARKSLSGPMSVGGVGPRTEGKGPVTEEWSHASDERPAVRSLSDGASEPYTQTATEKSASQVRQTSPADQNTERDPSSSTDSAREPAGSASNGAPHERLQTARISGPPAILVVNKVDRAPESQVAVPDSWRQVFARRIATCARDGVGLVELERALLEIVGAGEATAEGISWAVNQRQAEQLVRASEALQRLVASIEDDLPIDFWTVDVREAALALGQISGDDVTEEVLDGIFSRFCIGK